MFRFPGVLTLCVLVCNTRFLGDLLAREALGNSLTEQLLGHVELCCRLYVATEQPLGCRQLPLGHGLTAVGGTASFLRLLQGKETAHDQVFFNTEMGDEAPADADMSADEVEDDLEAVEDAMSSDSDDDDDHDDGDEGKSNEGARGAKGLAARAKSAAASLYHGMRRVVLFMTQHGISAALRRPETLWLQDSRHFSVVLHDTKPRAEPAPAPRTTSASDAGSPAAKRKRRSFADLPVPDERTEINVLRVILDALRYFSADKDVLLARLAADLKAVYQVSDAFRLHSSRRFQEQTGGQAEDYFAGQLHLFPEDVDDISHHFATKRGVTNLTRARNAAAGLSDLRLCLFLDSLVETALATAAIETETTTTEQRVWARQTLLELADLVTAEQARGANVPALRAVLLYSTTAACLAFRFSRGIANALRVHDRVLEGVIARDFGVSDLSGINADVAATEKLTRTLLRQHKNNSARFSDAITALAEADGKLFIALDTTLRAAERVLPEPVLQADVAQASISFAYVPWRRMGELLLAARGLLGLQGNRGKQVNQLRSSLLGWYHPSELKSTAEYSKEAAVARSAVLNLLFHADERKQMTKGGRSVISFATDGTDVIVLTRTKVPTIVAPSAEEARDFFKFDLRVASKLSAASRHELKGNVLLQHQFVNWGAVLFEMTKGKDLVDHFGLKKVNEFARLVWAMAGVDVRRGGVYREANLLAPLEATGFVCTTHLLQRHTWLLSQLEQHTNFFRFGGDPGKTSPIVVTDSLAFFAHQQQLNDAMDARLAATNKESTVNNVQPAAATRTATAGTESAGLQPFSAAPGPVGAATAATPARPIKQKMQTLPKQRDPRLVYVLAKRSDIDQALQFRWLAPFKQVRGLWCLQVRHAFGGGDCDQQVGFLPGDEILSVESSPLRAADVYTDLPARLQSILGKCWGATAEVKIFRAGVSAELPSPPPAVVAPTSPRSISYVVGGSQMVEALGTRAARAAAVTEGRAFWDECTRVDHVDALADLEAELQDNATADGTARAELTDRADQLRKALSAQDDLLLLTRLNAELKVAVEGRPSSSGVVDAAAADSTAAVVTAAHQRIQASRAALQVVLDSFEVVKRQHFRPERINALRESRRRRDRFYNKLCHQLTAYVSADDAVNSKQGVLVLGAWAFKTHRGKGQTLAFARLIKALGKAGVTVVEGNENRTSMLCPFCASKVRHPFKQSKEIDPSTGKHLKGGSSQEHAGTVFCTNRDCDSRGRFIGRDFGASCTILHTFLVRFFRGGHLGLFTSEWGGGFPFLSFFLFFFFAVAFLVTLVVHAYGCLARCFFRDRQCYLW